MLRKHQFQCPILLISSTWHLMLEATRQHGTTHSQAATSTTQMPISAVQQPYTALQSDGQMRIYQSICDILWEGFLQQALSRRNECVSMYDCRQPKQIIFFSFGMVDMQAVCHANFNTLGDCSRSNICAPDLACLQTCSTEQTRLCK